MRGTTRHWTWSALLCAIGACANAVEEPQLGVVEAALPAETGNPCWVEGFGAPLGMGNDDSRFVALPFGVSFYGVSYNSMYINSNGNITFNAPNAASSPTTVPSGSFVMAAPLFGDFDSTLAPDDDVFFGVVGTAPERRAVATWWRTPERFATPPNSFQAVFHESDGSIWFSYDSLGTDGFNWYGPPMSVGVAASGTTFQNIASGSAIPPLAGTTRVFQWTGGGYAVSTGCESPNQPPVADAGADQLLECTGPDGAQALLDASGSSDPDGDPLSFSWSQGGIELGTDPQLALTLAVGTHGFDLSVDDGADSDTDSTIVTVEDTTGPTVNMKVVQDVLFPPNRMMHLAVSGIESSDLCCDGDLVVGVEGGDADDHEIVDNGDGSFDVLLRAERDDRLLGMRERTYVVTATGTDCAGNITERTAEVLVPTRP